MGDSKKILIAFYGDDFTGSTDALEFLERAGARSILFLEPPSKALLDQYPHIDAFGIAGNSRSLPPAEMEDVLIPAFRSLKESGARHIHYKVCSTFDSSPLIGSIGKAIDIGATIFHQQFVPLLVAAPVLGRYCLFGNLFARMGIGSMGEIFRLDRHPSMKNHPVTPADESDLRIHLSRQTSKKTGLVDVLSIAGSLEEKYRIIEDLCEKGNEIILFDAVYQEQLTGIGQLIDQVAGDGTFFSVGSSGIEMALGQFYAESGKLKTPGDFPNLTKLKNILVISGSCSPVTASQISWARDNGFAEKIIDTDLLEKNEQVFNKTRKEIASLIKQGVSVVCHSNGAFEKSSTIDAQKLGGTLGKLALAIREETDFQRLVIAGGDTSSYAARSMGIKAVKVKHLLVPGAPVCEVMASGDQLNGLEINFKGGQVGGSDYFGLLKN